MNVRVLIEKKTEKYKKELPEIKNDEEFWASNYGDIDIDGRGRPKSIIDDYGHAIHRDLIIMCQPERPIKGKSFFRDKETWIVKLHTTNRTLRMEYNTKREASRNYQIAFDIVRGEL